MNIEQAFKKTTGLTLEEGTKKAIEGGWDCNKNYWVVELGGAVNLMHQADILLDPHFWQSLGRALGWNPNLGHDLDLVRDWRYYQHRFIDHLAEESPKEDTR